MADGIRLLMDGPWDGPTNMGRDEALLRGVGAATSPPTLRWYQWSTATISLGYFQPIREYETLPPPAGTLPIVRRVTGGGAILHDGELTYALALPVNHRLASRGPSCLYDTVHRPIIEALVSCGVSAQQRGPCGSSSSSRTEPFFCFSRRHSSDVVVGGNKLVGSAQRRRRNALLQHGSIILERTYAQQLSAAVGSSASIDVSFVIEAVTKRMAATWDIRFEPSTWSEEELSTAAEESDRFRDPAFLRRR